MTGTNTITVTVKVDLKLLRDLCRNRDAHARAIRMMDDNAARTARSNAVRLDLLEELECAAGDAHQAEMRIVNLILAEVHAEQPGLIERLRTMTDA